MNAFHASISRCCSGSSAPCVISTSILRIKNPGLQAGQSLALRGGRARYRSVVFTIRAGHDLFELGPNVLPVVGTKFLTCHFPASHALDSDTTIRGWRSFPAGPLADETLRYAKRFGEFTLPLLARGEIGSEIHGRNIRTSLFISKEKKALLITPSSTVLATLIKITPWQR